MGLTQACPNYMYMYLNQFYSVMCKYMFSLISFLTDVLLDFIILFPRLSIFVLCCCLRSRNWDNLTSVKLLWVLKEVR